MPLVPLTLAFFLYAVLFAAMGWEIAAAVAGGLGVLNQAIVAFAVAAEEPPSTDVVDGWTAADEDGDDGDW